MEKLEYKGYYGSVEYSKEDNCLFGKVLGMPDNLILYEGDTANELYNDFKDAIDHYLSYCKASNAKPRKSYNGMLNIRIPSEVHCKMAMYAEDTGTSVNAFIRDSIERRLEHIN